MNCTREVEYAAIAEELEGLAEEYNLGLWTAEQYLGQKEIILARLNRSILQMNRHPLRTGPH